MTEVEGSIGPPGLKFQDAPPQTFPLLRKLIPRKLQPMIRGLRRRWARRRLNLEEPYYSVQPYIQASRTRQQNLVRLGELIESENVPGVVMECGVLDGGASALMAYATRASARPVHMFDAWEGLPPATIEDKDIGQKWVGQVVGSPKRVFKVMQSLKIEPTRLHVHRGWFHETFPEAVKQIDQVALLHIDCDFYEPTRLCFETWYPKLASGAYVQIDDYLEFVGSKQATDEFLALHPEIKLEVYGQGGQAIYFRKP